MLLVNQNYFMCLVISSNFLRELHDSVKLLMFRILQKYLLD